MWLGLMILICRHFLTPPRQPRLVGGCYADNPTKWHSPRQMSKQHSTNVKANDKCHNVPSTNVTANDKCHNIASTNVTANDKCHNIASTNVTAMFRILVVSHFRCFVLSLFRTLM